MNEYIGKEALQEKLNRKKAGPATKRYTDGWNDAILMVKSMIHSEKAADVVPVRHGRWIDVREKRLFGDHYFLCSNCKSRNGSMISFNYCPNCGAKMDLHSECEQDVER